MIALVQGKVVSCSGQDVLILTSGGLGYNILVSPGAAQICTVGSAVSLETHLVVKEDALDLYGFVSGAEKKLFKNFVSVSGVGPKTAMHLFSLGSVEEIVLAVGRGDTDFLTKVSGIGKKTAERIVVELREKMQKEQTAYGKVSLAENMSSSVNDALEGLITLGYTPLQARETLKKIQTEGKNNEQLLREALRIIK
ncbi:MAG: Holliday junction branch migration protein RuvA [Candidatus Magasanikbacteria bacterium]|nr:Holliday junction branch migration protein RuvA [Candidatus Magasanikbacteria bacterium]